MDPPLASHAFVSGLKIGPLLIHWQDNPQRPFTGCTSGKQATSPWKILHQQIEANAKPPPQIMTYVKIEDTMIEIEIKMRNMNTYPTSPLNDRP